MCVLYHIDLNAQMKTHDSNIILLCNANFMCILVEYPTFECCKTKEPITNCIQIVVLTKVWRHTKFTDFSKNKIRYWKLRNVKCEHKSKLLKATLCDYTPNEVSKRHDVAFSLFLLLFSFSSYFLSVSMNVKLNCVSI